MKKILLTCTVALMATFSYAQRSIDWSVEQLISPTQLKSTETGTAFDVEAVFKNNGTDSVFSTDTVGVQLILAQGNQLIIAYPAANQISIFECGKDMGPGDTMHYRISLNTQVIANFSFNFNFITYSEIRRFSGDNTIEPEGTGTNANNVMTTPMVWQNKQGWGVGLNAINANSMFNVSPNPAKNNFQVSMNFVNVNSATELTIMDATGRVVYTETSASNDLFNVNTEAFAKGLYIVMVKNGNITNTAKVNVQ